MSMPKPTELAELLAEMGRIPQGHLGCPHPAHLPAQGGRQDVGGAGQDSSAHQQEQTSAMADFMEQCDGRDARELARVAIVTATALGWSLGGREQKRRGCGRCGGRISTCSSAKGSQECSRRAQPSLQVDLKTSPRVI